MVKRCGPSVTTSCGLQDKTHGKTIRQTDYIGPRLRQATRADIGQLHTDCQWSCLQKGRLLDVHTGQVSLFNTLVVGKRNGLSLQSCLEWMQAYERDKTQGTCQLVRVVQSYVKTISEPECLALRQVVQLRDILSDTSHKITAKTPVTRLRASPLIFCQEHQLSQVVSL